jgi:hypothetical protein
VLMLCWKGNGLTSRRRLVLRPPGRLRAPCSSNSSRKEGPQAAILPTRHAETPLIGAAPHDPFGVTRPLQCRQPVMCFSEDLAPTSSRCSWPEMSKLAQSDRCNSVMVPHGKS